jgi:RNA ligase
MISNVKSEKPDCALLRTIGKSQQIKIKIKNSLNERRAVLLQDYLDVEELRSDIEAGYVNVADHHELPLNLYTYSRAAQFDGHWTDATSKCRGLIVDTETGEIVALCMPKFHNYSEHINGKEYAGALPDEPFEIFAKVDGSMGTVFNYSGRWLVATKGSFHSEQAQWATKHLNEGWYANLLMPSHTYVVEIIYPTNRIVVDYGNREDLVLLTSYAVYGGEVVELPASEHWDWPYSIVESYDPHSLSLEELAYLAEENICVQNEDDDVEVSGTEAEGYVIRYQSGTRVKIKFSEYLRFHKILTNCTERSVWEALYNKTDLAAFEENVPDEFDEWFKATKAKILNYVCAYLDNAKEEFLSIRRNLGYYDFEKFTEPSRRKEFAQAAVQSEYRGALFLLLDSDSNPKSLEKLRELAFKSCYPSATKPFRADAEG